MNDLIFTLGFLFNVGGSMLPIQCEYIAVVVTAQGPRLGFFCTSPVPTKEIPDEDPSGLRARFDPLRLDD